MTTHTAPRCFFTSCKTPVTHTVQRLWLIGGKPLPMLHCCDKHIPGSKAAPGRLTWFYDVQPMDAHVEA